MRKKIILFTTTSIILIIIIAIIIINNQEVQFEDRSVCKISSFTITDDGTDIEVKINDKNSKNSKWNEVAIYLYDSNSNIIKKINKKLSKDNNLSIHIKEKEKYTQVEKMDCVAYGTKYNLD